MSYIGLLDCNNFFVSCERLFRPDLANKPVAVLSSNDGCIVARSQEVKDMGIPMGMPLFKAKKLVDMDTVTLFSSNFTLYRDISARVMDALKAEVPDMYQYSVDEAFFMIDDVTEADLATLRARIMQKTGIPVAIGVSNTKTLAKEASEIGKKGNGVCLLTPELWQKRAVETPCGHIWNLGRATATKLQGFGVATASQFMALERQFVRSNFGLGAERVYDELHGTSVATLRSRVEHDRKSTVSSRSFAAATHDLLALQSAVAYHVTHASKKIRQAGLAATIMYLELRASRHGDFAYRKGSTQVVFDVPTNSTQEMIRQAHRAVAEAYDSEVPYKKAGVTLSGLVSETFASQSLFERADSTTSKTLDHVLDAVQQKFGFSALHSAAILPNPDQSSRKLRSKAYTTAWGDIPTVRA